MAKKYVNRLKIMLAVTRHSNKWLAEMLGKEVTTIVRQKFAKPKRLWQ